MRQLRKLFSASRKPDARKSTTAVPAETVLTLPGTSRSRATDAAIAQGSAHFKAGRLAETLAIVDQGLVEAPEDGTLLFARASTLFAWGRFAEALESFRRASDVGLSHFDLDMQLGWTYMRLGRAADAEAHFRKAVATEPESESAWIALANALESRGALAAEAHRFVDVLSRWPQNYDAVMLLAACRAHLGDQDGSTAEFRRVVELNPTRSRGWSNLGVALGWREQYEEGLQALRRAFDIDRSNGTTDTLQNLATALREEGHFDEAMNLLDEILQDKPDANALWLRSVMLLEAGRLAEGWVQHEFRWMREPLASVRWTLRRPVWDGQDLRGKTVMLHAEQGFGDAIQFIRYARMLKQCGARVIFDAFRDFAEISHDFDDVDEVAQDGAMPDFDYHIPLLSLPRVLGTTLSSIPAHVPYLRVRPERSERWAGSIGEGNKLKVGLVWAGNPKHVRDGMRSIPLARFARLARIEGVQLYSLQKGDRAVDQIASSGVDIIDLASEFDDFCDTAAAIGHLDLVISVDTSVAHLAGALAKPVWTMIAEPADWRWLTNGDRTPWYPTMRLFRQQKRNRWDSVIEDVESALQELAATRCPGDTQSSRTLDSVPVWDGCETRLADACEAEPLRLCRVAETRYGILQYSPKDRVVAESLRYYGEYLQPQLALLGRFMRPGSWVVDARAGIGIDTLFMAECAGAQGHVLAYEPDAYYHQIIAQNLAANRVKNVTLLHRTVAGPTDSRSSIDVPADTVDGLRLSRLDWIRMKSGDCIDVLSGARDTLWRLRPWLFVAGETFDQIEQCKEAVRDYGYQSRPLSTPLFSAQNYNRRCDDIFAGDSALSLLCIPEEIEVDIELTSGNSAPELLSSDVA
jgi:tetratricopeptide (TPR) repeat protein